MLWAQLGLLAIHMISLGISLAQHGQPKTGEHHFGVAIFGVAIALVLLYFAGAFNQIIGGPQ